MTYGDSAREIRATMAQLLAWHRIQIKLGGPGGNRDSESTTLEQRARLGDAIQAYRRAALVWCLEASVAVLPPRVDVTRDREKRLPERLTFELARIRQSTPLSELLGTRHEHDLVATWQRLARASVVGEREFSAGVNRGALSEAQIDMVLNDVAAVVRGLVVLDRRYSETPGWIHLHQPKRLEQAAECLHAMTKSGSVDDSVASRGWRPALSRVEVRGVGVAGSLAAQHNLLIELRTLPNALNFRRVMHSQAAASHRAAVLARLTPGAPAEQFEQRALLYRDLVRASRDLGGLAGGGGQAVQDSMEVSRQLEGVLPEAGVNAPWHELGRLFTACDSRLATMLEIGIAERAYFVRIRHPDLDEQQDVSSLLRGKSWTPLLPSDQSELLQLARERLAVHLEHTEAAPPSVLTSGLGLPRRAGPAVSHGR
jgi:hypothetical protein